MPGITPRGEASPADRHATTDDELRAAETRLPNHDTPWRMPPPTIRLALAGFAATAVAFGPARMGFGLFLPAFREEFALSSTLAGFIASGGFMAFLVALPLAAWLGDRFGPRAPVMAGALAAAAGFALAASAPSAAVLAAGIALAGASAGLCWTPFNDAVERVVSKSDRAGALSAVSTGTTAGVAAAGALALAVSLGPLDWRAAWVAFACAGCAAALAALAVVPAGASRQCGGAPARPRLVTPATLPLYGAALCFGAVNAIYLSFAADRVVAAGGLTGLPDRTASAVIFLAYGVFGIAGLATGRIESRTGLAPLLGAIFAAFAASLVLVGLTPASWPAVVVSAGLHGAAVMTVSAVLSFWSLRMFPGAGSIGFTAVLIGAAAGSVLGPAAAGVLVDAVGAMATFLAAALPPLAIALACAVRIGADKGRSTGRSPTDRVGCRDAS